MFIGHYAPALALKGATSRVPLWSLFVAVQLVDFAWDAFVFTGIEHARLVPGITASNDLDLYDMPLTHSLVGSVAWALAAAAIAHRVLGGEARDRRVGAGIIGVAVLSHWFLDVVVHRPDLTLAGAGTPAVGLALWDHPFAETALEVGLVIAAGLHASRSSRAPRATMLLTLALAVVALLERVMPPPTSMNGIVLAAFAAYVMLALAAARVDRAERNAG